MERPHTLAAITRLASTTARRAAAIATRSGFTAEEILEDVAIEARRNLMRAKWGPPSKTPEMPDAPPHPPKTTKNGDTTC